MQKKYALLSVFNKTKLETIARCISEHGFTILATPGTKIYLNKHNINAIDVTPFTHNPPVLKDAIQTISFHISGGILFNRAQLQHQKAIKKYSLPPIDIVISNFTSPEKLVHSLNEFNITKIDVGGPLMVRSAAVNFQYVTVITDINDYEFIIQTLNENNHIPLPIRKKLAIKAFKYTSNYDQQLSSFLNKLN